MPAPKRAARPGTERRRAARVPVDVHPYHVGLLGPTGWLAIRAQILDVNALGLQLATEATVEIGDMLRVTFSLTGDPQDAVAVDLQARYVRRDAPGAPRHVGCAITDATDTALRTLRRAIRAVTR